MNEATTNRHTDHEKDMRGWPMAVIGSACFWSWGFLAYLSPVLIPTASPGGNANIDTAFFTSQSTVVITALLIVLAARRFQVSVDRKILFLGATCMSAASAILSFAAANSITWALVGCGIACGAGGILLGCAWGARYSLESKDVSAIVMASFLVAYAIYLLIVNLLYPAWAPLAQIATIALPLISAALWLRDALVRFGRSPEVFPAKASPDAGTAPDHDMPGEVVAGSREVRALPWRSIGVLVMAALVGNTTSSYVLSAAYETMPNIYPNCILIGAFIAALSLIPLTRNHTAFSVSQLYITTVTFSAIGLVIIMVTGTIGIAYGIALVQGCAVFLQPIVYVEVTRATHEEGLSPLLSFGFGQALISGALVLGSVFAWLLSSSLEATPLLLSATCGTGLLILFFMLANRASDADSQTLRNLSTLQEPDAASSFNSVDGDGGNALSQESGPNAILTSSEGPGAMNIDHIAAFSQSTGLTARETEVLGYLVRGRSLPYIANELFVTTGTIKTHVRHIYEKAQVNSRQELLDKVENS